MLALKSMRTDAPRGDLTGVLQAVAGGDRDALAELYRLVEAPVYRFALSRLKSTGEASDVLQDVMLELWRRAGSFQGRSRPLTWILGITYHKIVDVLRRRGRFAAEPPEDEGAADEVITGPLERTERGERRRAVLAAIDALSDAHREVVHLAFFEDLSYPEIARLLEIPEGTVKTRMFHARKALQRQLSRSLFGANP